MSEDKKLVPVNPGEKAVPIRLGGTNLTTLIGTVAAPLPADKLQTAIAISGHDAFLTRGGIITGTAADAVLAAAAAKVPVKSRPQTKQARFSKGETVYDTVKCRKATIVKLHAASTKGGFPAHKLIAKNGDAWLQSERKLQKL